jgi:hypothetical protein
MLLKAEAKRIKKVGNSMKTEEVKKHKTRYSATSSLDGFYQVSIDGLNGEWEKLAGMPVFDTFEAADKAAKDIAGGMFRVWWPAGEYISMR